MDIRPPVKSTLLIILVLAIVMTGCASRMAKQDQENSAAQASAAREAEPAIVPAIPVNPRETSFAMNARLDALESKIAQMNEKLDAQRAALDGFFAAHAPKLVGVPSHAADTAGNPVSVPMVASDSESGFVHDPALQNYRKAQILLDSGKYPDAILAFSTFLEKSPDHALAGSAQFHVGEAYFKQKEYRQAEQELQKVLTSYDRSVHIADALKLMSEAEDQLHKPQDAAKHRQQLTSLFANSPAAQNISVISPSGASLAPAEPAQSAQDSPSSMHSTIEDGGIPANPVTKAAKPGLDEPPSAAPLTAPMTETAPAMEKNTNE